MSKISEENLTRKALVIFWKRLGGWAIGLKDKYVLDPFFKSQWNVVMLQISFSGILLIAAFFFFDSLYEDISSIIVNGITSGISSGTPLSGEEILVSAEVVKAKAYLWYVLLGTTFTLLASLVIAKVTLTPARKALESQKRFVRDIAHELRTPLSVMKTNSEVAIIDEPKGTKAYSIAKDNIEELDRISQIINNILSFNRSVGSHNMKFEEVNLEYVLSGSLRDLRDLYEKRKLDLEVRKSGTSVVWGNNAALRQIFSNILKNAINYSADNGKILISLEPDYFGNVIFTVEDKGVGMSRNELRQIFEPFYRADKSRSRKLGSSGLGMTIVSELLKAHSGKIIIRSLPGSGTVVTVTMPYYEAEKNGREKKPSSDEISIDFS